MKTPDSFEGESFAELVRGKKEDPNQGALYMSVAPFASVKKEVKKEYRALKTKQYTYVKGIEGPWLLYDDLTDPYQMNNLIANPDYTEILSNLDAQLESELKEINDDFRPGTSYISEWGYEVAKAGHIPYQSYDQKPQSPKKKLK